MLNKLHLEKVIYLVQDFGVLCPRILVYRLHKHIFLVVLVVEETNFISYEIESFVGLTVRPRVSTLKRPLDPVSLHALSLR